MQFLNTVICYNNSDEVIRYIQGLLANRPNELTFSVVINSGSEKDKFALNHYSQELSDGKVFVFDPGSNLGYMNGLLYGYREYIKHYPQPDYIIFSNTDIVIPDTMFFERFEAKQYGGEVGCVGPSIYVKSRNAYDNPVCVERRSLQDINRLIKILSIPVLRGVYVNLADFKGRMTRKAKESSKYVYEVHGCFFIISNAFASCLAQKDYGALLYSEEAYVAENIRKYGFKTFYDADLEVIHLEHSVTKGLKGERIAKHIRSSMMLIREEYYLNE
jgi:GT2 family glycosyltransferase